MKVEKKLYKLY